MSLTDEETLELHELLDGLVENNLSPSRKAKLEKWIAESEEVRKTYVCFMDMSASLVHYADERLSDETEEVVGNSSIDKIVMFVLPLTLVAALLIAGFYLPRAWVDREKIETDLKLIYDNEIIDTWNNKMWPGDMLSELNWLVKEQAKNNNYLKKGDLILTGAYGFPVPINDKKLIEVTSSAFGDVKATFY